MRGQDAQHNCGPYALLNALRALGVQRTAAELEVLCGTTMTDGTSVRQMTTAARKMEGLTPCHLKERRADVALLRARNALVEGRPVLLVTDAGAHWETAVGVLGWRFLVADPADAELVLSFAPDELVTRWRPRPAGYFEGVIL